MSGGSYDYAYSTVEDVAEQLRGREKDPLRRAFAEHLVKVAEAMRVVEWVDSGNLASGAEDNLIRECLSKCGELEAATKIAEEVHKRLQDAIENARTTSNA